MIPNSSLIVSSSEPTGVNRKKVWMQKGKNLFDGKYNTNYGYSQTTGELISTSDVYSNVNKIAIPLNATKICVSKAGVAKATRFFFYDKNKSFISTVAVTGSPFVAIIPTNARYCNFQMGTVTANSDFSNIQVEAGIDSTSLSTDYEEYIEPAIYVKNDNDLYEEFINVDEIQTKAKILWQNSNPSAEFTEQTISLNSNDYDMLKIFYYGKNSEQLSTDIIKGKNSWLNFSMNTYNSTDGNGIINLSRGLRYVSDTSLKFTNCNSVQIFKANSIFATDNTGIIPLCIVGYKTGLF